MTEWYDYEFARVVNDFFRYKLSDGSSGTTSMDKKEFKKMLKKGIKIIGWEKK